MTQEVGMVLLQPKGAGMADQAAPFALLIAHDDVRDASVIALEETGQWQVVQESTSPKRWTDWRS